MSRAVLKFDFTTENKWRIGVRNPPYLSQRRGKIRVGHPAPREAGEVPENPRQHLDPNSMGKSAIEWATQAVSPQSDRGHRDPTVQGSLFPAETSDFKLMTVVTIH